jgi:gas vesicle protein
MLKQMLFGVTLTALAGVAVAQETGVSQRDLSLQFSRYDGIIGRLEAQNERLLQDIRALQREQARVTKVVDGQQQEIQGGIDQLQEFKNTEIENIKQSFWGSGTRDCKELGVKHQQIKVTVKPDGSESVRFLCFDGKPLMLGAERYFLGN